MFTKCQKPFKHFTCANLFSPYDNKCLELSLSSLYISEDCGAQKFKKKIYKITIHDHLMRDQGFKPKWSLLSTYILKEYTTLTNQNMNYEQSNQITDKLAYTQ